MVTFVNRGDHSRLSMESFRIELVSGCTSIFFSDKTLNFFRNFLLEQLTQWEGEWEVAISEKSYPSMYHNVTERKFVFLTRNFQICQNSTLWNLVFTLPLRILLKLWTLSFRKHTITAKAVSQLKCLQELKKLTFTLGMKDPVSRFFSRDLRHIFGSNVGNTASPAYTLSW